MRSVGTSTRGLAPTPAPFTCLLVHVETAATHRVERAHPTRTGRDPLTRGSRPRASAFVSARPQLRRRAARRPGRRSRWRCAAAVAAPTQPEPPVVAKRHCSSTVPWMPSIFASASVTSSWRPGSASALSITSLSTCLSRSEGSPSRRREARGASRRATRASAPARRSCAARRPSARASRRTRRSSQRVPARSSAPRRFRSSPAERRSRRRRSPRASATAESSTRRWAKSGYTAPSVAERAAAAWERAGCRARELLWRHLRRRAAHRVETRLVLRERNDVTQVRLAGEHHGHPVDAERDPSVRRRTHRERVQQEPELRRAARRG